MGCKGGKMWYQILEKTESGYWRVASPYLDEDGVIRFVNANSSDAFRRMKNIDECMGWFYIEKDQYRLVKVREEKQVKNGF